MASSSAARQAVGATARVAGKGKKSAFRQKKFIIGGIIILLAIGSLIFYAMMGTTQYYMTVAELKKSAATLAPAEQVRVSGVVADGSIQSDPANNTIRFQVYDRNGDPNVTMNVEYKGVVPDTFKPGGDAIMEGVYSTGNNGELFTATSLMAKCPSKYEPASSGQ